MKNTKLTDEEFVGYKKNKIEVIGMGYKKNYRRFFECRCFNCGNIYYQTKNNLLMVKGETCKNCLNTNRKTHGMKHTKIYNVWKQLKHRCNCSKNDYNHWKNYAGRGITVCKEWEKSETFYEWAIKNGYNCDSLYDSGKNKLTIDRIDNDKGYSPDNCRIITHKQNQQNKRTTVRVNYKGSQYTLCELSKLLNLDYKVLRQRVKHGWSEERLSEPKRR